MKPGNISKQRILGQAKKLQQQKLSYLYAAPLDGDLYDWHFTIQGPQNTQFHEGLYHGQILLPYQYPFKPPDIVFFNKNGRFETNTKICLTITQYHPEQWNSAWTIRTMLEAVISLFAENVQGVGSLTSTPDIRRYLAKTSHSYKCEKCGPIQGLLPPRPPPIKSSMLNSMVMSRHVVLQQNNNQLLSTQFKKITLEKQKEKDKEKQQQQQQEKKDVAPSNNMLKSVTKKILISQHKPTKLKQIKQPISKYKLKRTDSFEEEDVIEEQENRIKKTKGPQLKRVEQSHPQFEKVNKQIRPQFERSEPNSQMGLSKAVKLIQSNVNRLQKVLASMAWVD